MCWRSPCAEERRRSRCGGFTIAELLVVIVIIGILASLLLPLLSSSKELGRRVVCMNNVRTLASALAMYVHENDLRFPPRVLMNCWPSRLHNDYVDTRLLQCPSDGEKPKSLSLDPAHYPADAAPRSYVINGWNDYFMTQYGTFEWQLYRNFQSSETMPESAISKPSDTVIFGEKEYESWHVYMDYEQYDDVEQLDQNKHSAFLNPSKGGGSNFAFSDGSVRFLKFGKSLSPINLWAVTEEYRNQSINAE